MTKAEAQLSVVTLVTAGGLTTRYISSSASELLSVIINSHDHMVLLKQLSFPCCHGNMDALFPFLNTSVL